MKYYALGSDGRFMEAKKLLKRIKPDEIQADTDSASQEDDDLDQPSNRLKRVKKFATRLFDWRR